MLTRAEAVVRAGRLYWRAVEGPKVWWQQREEPDKMPSSWRVWSPTLRGVATAPMIGTGVRS